MDSCGELERFPSRNSRDAKGRISEWEDRTLATISWLVSKMQEERKRWQRGKGCKTSKMNDSTRARIIVKRVSQRKEEKGCKHTKRERNWASDCLAFLGQTWVFLY